jgi:hypothetical protein
MGLDAKTYWLTDRQSQCDFDFDFDASPTPPFLSKEEQQKKEKKNKSLDIEQIYGHGSQRGSMPGVTVLAGCRQ